METEIMPDSKSVQTFIPATVRLSPGLEADIREKLAQAFGADDKTTPVKAYWGFEDLMTALLVDWMRSGDPFPMKSSANGRALPLFRLRGSKAWLDTKLRECCRVKNRPRH